MPNCDAPIVWKNYTTFDKRPNLHPETNRPRPLIAPSGSELHKCMFKGQKWFFEKKPKGEKLTDYKEYKED
jgi:hypothetical protein